MFLFILKSFRFSRTLSLVYNIHNSYLTIMQKQVKLKEIVISNMNIFYEEYGSGSNFIILLHGWGQSHAFWTNLIGILSKKYHLFVLDLPGFGLSKEPPKVWDLSDYAQFVHEFAARNHIKKPIIIGHSFGGRIATVYAVQFPVEKLVLYSSGGLNFISLKSEFNQQIVVRLGKYIFPNFLYKSHTTIFKPKHYENRIIVNSNRSRRMLDIHTRPFESLKEKFEKIKVKTLIIVGEKDFITSPLIGRTAHKLIKNSFFIEVPRATHFSHIEASKIFNNALIKFLSED